MNNIDIERLREDLLNYFGTAAFQFPFAFMDVIDIQYASAEELIRIAKENGFDLNKYIIDKKKVLF